MKLLIRLLLCFLAVNFSGAFAKCDDENSAKEMISHLNIGPYQYRMHFDLDTADGNFQILHNGKVLLSEEGSHFYINSKEKNCGLPIAGSSLTRSRRHELVVLDFSGGAHCCFDLYIIALGKNPYLIQKIQMAHTELPEFIDFDHDGIPEIRLQDWTFAYWKIAFAQSPSPDVILKYNGKKWIFSQKLMIKPKPTVAQFSKVKKDVKDKFQIVPHDAGEGDNITGAPVLLWEEMLNFIYSGHADIALRLIEESWPVTNPHKDEFLTEFRAQLKESPYYKFLQEMNSNASIFF